MQHLFIVEGVELVGSDGIFFLSSDIFHYLIYVINIICN